MVGSPTVHSRLRRVSCCGGLDLGPWLFLPSFSSALEGYHSPHSLRLEPLDSELYFSVSFASAALLMLTAPGDASSVTPLVPEYDETCGWTLARAASHAAHNPT